MTITEAAPRPAVRPYQQYVYAYPHKTAYRPLCREHASLRALWADEPKSALSLYFHILFAVVGIGMPLLMVVAEWRYRRSGDPICLDLARRWAKGTAILFAVADCELGGELPLILARRGGRVGCDRPLHVQPFHLLLMLAHNLGRVVVDHLHREHAVLRGVGASLQWLRRV